MKKFVLITTLLFCSLVATAPNLSFDEAIHLRYNLICTLHDKENQKQFDAFTTALGKRESNNDWQATNPYGCIGEWQFAEGTLKMLGYKNINRQTFTANPAIFTKEMQRKALEKLVQINLAGLQPYMHYVGKVINGVKITKAGLIAGTHLGGIGSVQRYLTSNGQVNVHDANGTSIADYIQAFSQYRV